MAVSGLLPYKKDSDFSVSFNITASVILKPPYSNETFKGCHTC